MKKKISTVTTKGQPVIPAKLQPLTPEFIRSLRGSLKGEPSSLKILLEQRKRGRKL